MKFFEYDGGFMRTATILSRLPCQDRVGKRRSAH